MLPEPDVPAGTEMVTMTVREALRDAMAEEMRRDGDVFVMGEEVAEYQGAYKVTQGLLQEFGARRVIDTPITEHGFAGLGVGAALAGLKPIVEFMTFNFAMQAMDQLINSAAKTRYMSGGQIARARSCSADRTVRPRASPPSTARISPPGTRTFRDSRWSRPTRAADAKGLLKSAIRDPNPVMFLENEILYGQSFPVPKLDDYRGADRQGQGRARRQRRHDRGLVDGHDLCAQGGRASSPRTASRPRSSICARSSPMDIETIVASVKKTGRLVTVEEGWRQSGVGAEIAACVMEQAFDWLDAPVLRVTGKDVPMPYAANLEKLALPSVAEVVEAAKAVCYR